MFGHHSLATGLLHADASLACSWSLQIQTFAVAAPGEAGTLPALGVVVKARNLRRYRKVFPASAR